MKVFKKKKHKYLVFLHIYDSIDRSHFLVVFLFLKLIHICDNRELRKLRPIEQNVRKKLCSEKYLCSEKIHLKKIMYLQGKFGFEKKII